MYLTRIRLNNSPYATRAKDNPQVMHAIVAKSFDGAARPLWRRDGGVVWVVADIEPVTTENIPGQVDTKSIKSALGSLSDGLVVAFRVQLNPTKSTPVPGKRGTYTPIIGEQEQHEWAERRLSEAGLDLSQLRRVQGDYMKFNRKGSSTPTTWAVFEGTAVVKDADALRVAMTNGIGRQKAYGNGLLTIAKAA